jgi:hypothetical protein
MLTTILILFVTGSALYCAALIGKAAGTAARKGLEHIKETRGWTPARPGRWLGRFRRRDEAKAAAADPRESTPSIEQPGIGS